MSGFKKIIIFVLIIAAFSAGVYFKDDVLKLYNSASWRINKQIQGFQKTDINIGSMLVSTELFFGPLFAYLMFRESLSTSEIIGSILVILAVINVNLKK